ncbi:MAG: hypothetical protein QM399_00545 [Bacillota bacterium]|nr:hypothetical protein [Bacillota bacterium]
MDWSVEIIGVVLKSLGYEYNETDPGKVAQAKEKLFALKDNIVRFETNTPEDSLVNGEAVVGFMYSNQAVEGRRPTRGCSLCSLPKGSQFILTAG